MVVDNAIVEDSNVMDTHMDSDSNGEGDNNEDDGFGVGFYRDGSPSDCNDIADRPEARWPFFVSPAPGSNAQAQSQAQRSSTLGQINPFARGAAASVTLIPDDPEQPLIECGRCVYAREGDRGRVDIRAESFPESGTPPGQSGWELVVGDADGTVCLSGVIEDVERGVKIARYTVRITAPDSPSTVRQNSSPCSFAEFEK